MLVRQRQLQLYVNQAVGFKFLLLGMVFLGLAGCAATLPQPAGPESALLMVSIEAQRSIGSNNPSIVVITRKEDKQDFHYTSQDGKYYFFANLPKGTYQIKAAEIRIKGNTTTTQTGSLTTTIRIDAGGVFNFSQDLIEQSITLVRQGEVAFMGRITAEGTAKGFPPGAIDITNIRLDKSKQDVTEAFDYFKATFKESPWLGRLN